MRETAYLEQNNIFLEAKVTWHKKYSLLMMQKQFGNK